MTSTTKIPHGLYLVGCGPGDPELLTSAADSVLKSADVLICDSLIYESFKNRYEKNMIKRPRWQDELNKLILKHLSLGHTVARLKVGDVTLYARTKMESSLAVPTFLIPGISASTSSALYANVLTTSPIADRTVVVTGTSIYPLSLSLSLSLTYNNTNRHTRKGKHVERSTRIRLGNHVDTSHGFEKDLHFV